MALPRRDLRPALLGTPRPPKMFLWVCASGGLHVMLMLIAFGTMGRGLIAGHGIAEGSGFGGTSVLFEIEGDRDLVHHGAIPSQDAVPLDPEPPPPEPPASEPSEERASVTLHAERRAPDGVPDTHDEPAELAPREPAPAPPPPRPAPARPAPEVQGDDSATPGPAEEAAGTGGEDSTAGAPAGDARGIILDSAGLGGSAITASRALLPDGGRCDDPAVGTWRTQKYRPEGFRGTWVRFILRIRRQDEQLSGTITSRIWRGSASDPSPGECTAFGFDHTWRMDARGRIDGDRMTFSSSRARLIRQDCPSSDSRYAPDNFTGTIDRMRDTFQSRNNDGAFDIDEPYTFRRVSCE